ncbi:MAG TPA: hypothetical protein VNP72_00630, partial [Longimicrobium sp.]|nr:hypothetical protein [Longimicrobium sp.]
LHPPALQVVMRGRYAAAGSLMHFPRVRLYREADGTISASLTGAQGSGVATSMAAADALLIVPPDTEAQPGDVLRAVPLGAAPLVEEPPF